jgi:hypothetical protein
MRVRRGYLGWGVFLILAGAVPLAVRSGYLTDDQVGRLWSLWPLILVGIGVGLILRWTRFAFVGGLIVAATFGLMVGGLLSTGIGTVSTGACGNDAGSSPFPTRDGTLGSASSVSLQLNCGNLTIATQAGNAWQVAGQGANGSSPQIKSSETALEVKSPDRTGAFWAFGQRDVWRVTLPQTPTLDVDLQLNAGSTTADLGAAALGSLDLELNAGSAAVDLGSITSIEGIDVGLNAGSIKMTLPNLSMTGSIEANAGSVKLCAPAGAGLRLRTGDSLLATYDYSNHGLVKVGTTWTTPGYDSASVQIDLHTTANAGTFELDPEGGCD